MDEVRVGLERRLEPSAASKRGLPARGCREAGLAAGLITGRDTALALAAGAEPQAGSPKPSLMVLVASWP